MAFHGLIAHFFLVLSNIPLSGGSIVYWYIHLQKNILVDSRFWPFMNKDDINTHVRGFFFVDISFQLLWVYIKEYGFPDGSLTKESTCNAGAGLIPGWGRSPGGGHGNPLQYSCLENPMDRGARQATTQGVAESWTKLSN